MASAPAERILDYQTTCIGGLEEVATDELRVVTGGRVQGLRVERGAVGRLLFRYEGSPRQLLGLGCATAILAVARQAHDVTVGRPGLGRVLRCVSRLPLDACRRIARTCQAGVEEDAYELTVTVRGSHRFGAAEVAEGAHRILREQLGLRCEGSAPLRLVLQVQSRRALLGIHLGPRRPSGDPQREGWPGPAARSVARLLDLAAGDRVLALPGGCRGELAFLECEGAGRGVALSAARFRLPLADGAVDAAMVVPLARGRPELAEIARVVAPGGVVALLVAPGDDLAARLHDFDIPLEVMGGLGVYVRRRRWALLLLGRVELLGIGPA